MAYDAKAGVYVPKTLKPDEFEKFLTENQSALLGGTFDPGFTKDAGDLSVELPRDDGAVGAVIYPVWKGSHLVWELNTKIVAFAQVGGGKKLSLATAYDFHLARIAAAAEGVTLQLLDDEYSGFRDTQQTMAFAAGHIEDVTTRRLKVDAEDLLLVGAYSWKNFLKLSSLWRRNEVDYHAYGQAVDIGTDPKAVNWMDANGKAFGFAREKVPHSPQYDPSSSIRGASLRAPSVSTFDVEGWRGHYVHKSNEIVGLATLDGLGLTVNLVPKSVNIRGGAVPPPYHLPDYTVVKVATTAPVAEARRLQEAVRANLTKAKNLWVSSPDAAEGQLTRTALFMAAAAGQGISAKRNTRSTDPTTAAAASSRGSSAPSATTTLVSEAILYNFQTGKWDDEL